MVNILNNIVSYLYKSDKLNTLFLGDEDKENPNEISTWKVIEFFPGMYVKSGVNYKQNNVYYTGIKDSENPIKDLSTVVDKYVRINELLM